MHLQIHGRQLCRSAEKKLVLLSYGCPIPRPPSLLSTIEDDPGWMSWEWGLWNSAQPTRGEGRKREAAGRLFRFSLQCSSTLESVSAPETVVVVTWGAIPSLSSLSLVHAPPPASTVYSIHSVPMGKGVSSSTITRWKPIRGTLFFPWAGQELDFMHPIHLQSKIVNEFKTIGTICTVDTFFLLNSLVNLNREGVQTDMIGVILTASWTVSVKRG